LNSDLIKGKIRELGMTQSDLAEKMGLSLSRFNAKLNETAGAEFSLGEAQAIIRILQLSKDQIEEIFLG